MNPVVFVIVAVLLTGLSLYLVAFPLLQRGRTARPVETSAEEELEELLAQRDVAFQALRELNFDHRVGKVSDEDFAQFEGNLKQAAADSLRALDDWEARADDELDAMIESEVRARRSALAAGHPCPSCGSPVAASDRFCTACGAEVVDAAPGTPTVALTCTKCSAALEEGDRFCARCGQPVAEAVAA